MSYVREVLKIPSGQRDSPKFDIYINTLKFRIIRNMRILARFVPQLQAVSVYNDKIGMGCDGRSHPTF